MKKRILFIIWSYTYGGGAESLLTMIVNNLNPDKYDISIVEYHHADIKVEPTNPNIHIKPYIEVVDDGTGHNKSYQLYHTPEVLRKKYIEDNYDLYVSFNYQIPTFLLPVGTKNIAWIHSDVYDLEGPAKVRDWMRQEGAFGKVEKIVAISDKTERSLRDLFPSHSHKLVKIYNGIKIEEIRKKSMEEIAVKLQHPAVLYVGRLEDRKDPIRLLDVIKLVHLDGKKVHLYYMGEGDLREELKVRVEKLGLSEYVHFLGYILNPFPIIKQCDVVSLLSKQEGFSMCLLESVALGKPFVTTDIGGASELSNNQTCGQIIETDEQAAQAICKYLDADKKMIAEVCEKSIMRFDIGNYIKQIESLFDSMLFSGIKKY